MPLAVWGAQLGAVTGSEQYRCRALFVPGLLAVIVSVVAELVALVVAESEELLYVVSARVAVETFTVPRKP